MTSPSYTPATDNHCLQCGRRIPPWLEMCARCEGGYEAKLVAPIIGEAIAVCGLAAVYILALYVVMP